MTGGIRWDECETQQIPNNLCRSNNIRETHKIKQSIEQKTPTEFARKAVLFTYLLF